MFDGECSNYYINIMDEEFISDEKIQVIIIYNKGKMKTGIHCKLTSLFIRITTIIRFKQAYRPMKLAQMVLFTSGLNSS